MPNTQIVPDLEKEIESYIQKGYRLDMVVPADSPTTAQVSKDGEILRLQTSSRNNDENLEAIDSEEIIIRRFDDTAWVNGRAGMQYRDLIPGRLGGRVIASHIRLVEGGPVPDYVHYHKVAFQMIYCKTGWIRVVYEDQGPPFILNAGDCVLQPPEIRHRVLESSAGAEVIEIGCPAAHETWVDHERQLPTLNFQPDRVFNGQRFVRHIAADAEWQETDGFQYRDTGIFAATNGLADVRILKCETANSVINTLNDGCLFYFVLNGEFTLNFGRAQYKLRQTENCVIPTTEQYTIQTEDGLELLEVSLRTRVR